MGSQSPTGMYPAKYSEELEKQLIEAQDIAKVATVAGATTSSNNFKVLVAELLKTNAKK